MLAAVLFVLIPVCRYLPHYRVIGSDGKEVVCHDNCPSPNLFGIDSEDFEIATNLPAAGAIIPLLSARWNYAPDNHDYLHDPIWRSSGFAIAGIVVWFVVGRFVDDVIAWRETGVIPKFRIGIFLFSLIAAGTSTASAFELSSLNSLTNAWHAVWILVWIFQGYSGVTMEIIWLLRARRPATY